MANACKVRCRVLSVGDRGNGTYIVELDPMGRVPRFSAGQFLHLTIDEYDPEGGFWPESRVFSIASRSGDRVIKVVYSVKGRYTRRMEETLVPGLEVWIKLPFGDFIINSRIHTESDVVLVAGGTGISPFIPFLEEWLEKGECSRRIRLHYGLRGPEQLLFGELLTTCCVAHKLDIQLWLESGEPDVVSSSYSLPVRKGRLSPEAILSECNDLREPMFFLSGPPAMIEVFKTSLSREGVAPGQIQIDAWE